jgi:hypothetical protein
MVGRKSTDLLIVDMLSNNTPALYGTIDDSKISKMDYQQLTSKRLALFGPE